MQLNPIKKLRQITEKFTYIHALRRDIMCDRK